MINIILFPFFLTVSFHPSLNIRIFLCLYSVGNSSVVRIISNNERAFYFILCFFVGSTLLGHTQDAIVIALYGTAATIEQTSSYNTHNTEEKGKFYITYDRGWATGHKCENSRLTTTISGHPAMYELAPQRPILENDCSVCHRLNHWSTYIGHRRYWLNTADRLIVSSLFIV